MRNMVELVSIDDTRITIDADSITAILEMKNMTVRDEQGKIHKLPDHTLVMLGSIQFKIKDTYDECINSIHEQEHYNSIGI